MAQVLIEIIRIDPAPHRRPGPMVVVFCCNVILVLPASKLQILKRLLQNHYMGLSENSGLMGFNQQNGGFYGN